MMFVKFTWKYKSDLGYATQRILVNTINKFLFVMTLLEKPPTKRRSYKNIYLKDISEKGQNAEKLNSYSTI